MKKRRKGHPLIRSGLRLGQLWYNGIGDIDMIVAIAPAERGQKRYLVRVMASSPGYEGLIGRVFIDPAWTEERSPTAWKLLIDVD